MTAKTAASAAGNGARPNHQALPNNRNPSIVGFGELSSASADDVLLTAALKYAVGGWAVFPLRPRGKEPLGRLVPNGCSDATTDAATIRRWWADSPDANVGINVGLSGQVVVDVDPRHGGDEVWRDLRKRHGIPDETVTALTGGGGTHLYFAEDGAAVASLGAKLGPGVDVKRGNSYVVAPPSVHPDGPRYEWELSGHPADVAPLRLPPELRALLTDGPAVAKVSKPIPESIPEGERNQALASLAGTMRRRGASQDGILAALLEENRSRCAPPLPAGEVERIAQSISRYAPADPNTAAALPVAALRTDAGNADRLVAEHGADLRYCHAWGTWLAWDGRRWARDEDDAAGRCAEATARDLYRKAAEAADNDEARQWGRWATSSLSQHRVRAMLEAARRKLPVSPAALDADPWALNVKNGILDLRTGELRPHDPEAYCTKLAPVAYDPNARLELWDRFLVEATDGDRDLMAWLQKAAGYTLTGDTGEEKLFFVHGPTATGKSTFLEAIRATLGDYARTADFETFLQRRHLGGPRPDIARLAGARFVPSIEVAKGTRLAQGLVKLLVGGDTVTARELYAREFEYRPAFKLWLAANDAPDMDAADDALWRRILRVPFDAVIPEGRRDPDVKTTLSDPDVAGPAILAWAVRGCLAWQRERLGVCPAVSDATRALRADMDRLRGFLADCCVLDANAWTPTAALREAYDRWCKENGERAIGGRNWSERLRANGGAPRLGRVGAKRTRGWGGIGLLADED